MPEFLFFNLQNLFGEPRWLLLPADHTELDTAPKHTDSLEDLLILFVYLIFLVKKWLKFMFYYQDFGEICVLIEEEVSAFLLAAGPAVTEL